MNIGQAAKASGLTAKMLRYYERIGLLAPAGRTDSGYRQYGAEDLRVLAFVRRSRELGFSLEEIRQLLSLWQDRQRASADVKALAKRHIAELDLKIAELTRLRSTLGELVSCCHGDASPDCPILDTLGG
ncbi:MULTISPECIES: Cu(I)-responsive transcriptional regulator [Pseudomonas]|uniref:Cu(I)-responsive transcriptional regulator n=1 Tax=Pseudomonas benzopyrenica TaxID=2993566 RepID=A0ABZ2FV83_9PSED|nr:MULTISPECIES: Cu(I)-responsive transcriptional regulator [Pseudomonas]MDC7831756.1 Cu(I)-responsive transcriptional regulator [Pseudomonas benzopyrenica]NRH42012.1 Cu(I)-responsive transcriptional regulator [Pseudomonas sp. MS15a(2019)]UUW69971.1 Cu(I)-responsive transcriptional regulator [Pseudomonas psychrotolerans]SEO73715.1 Cu(I)-responsive transcriptional regulator [Pseudomonas sp. Snoq117.2]